MSDRDSKGRFLPGNTHRWKPGEAPNPSGFNGSGPRPQTLRAIIKRILADQIDVPPDVVQLLGIQVPEDGPAPTMQVGELVAARLVITAMGNSKAALAAIGIVDQMESGRIGPTVVEGSDELEDLPLDVMAKLAVELASATQPGDTQTTGEQQGAGQQQGDEQCGEQSR